MLTNNNPSSPNSVGTIGALCAAPILAVMLMEIAEVNRILRTWIQGNLFWAYLLMFTVVLGLLLALGSLLLTKFGQLSLLNLSLVGLASGFIGSLVALPASPLLVGRGIAPAIAALKHPFYLMAISGLALGWLGGILGGLFAYAISHRRYILIQRAFVVAMLIRLAEIGIQIWLGEVLIR